MQNTVSPLATATRHASSQGRSAASLTQTDLLRRFQFASLLLLVLSALAAMVGCGGGYPGLGLSSLTASASVMDAGQSGTITAVASGNTPVAWALSGSGCGSVCGTLSSTGLNSGLYVSPVQTAVSFQVTITGTVPGTSDSRSTVDTVNPAPP